ncbi:MAG: glycosyltransferase [Candidatus Azobacteroides sp.]|nr:glycosyltransferase [Candidatus Azobacteroides sp.]
MNPIQTVMKSPAPIALFVYNRPQHLERTIRCLKNNELAGESDLFVFSDGPKTIKDEAKINEVRSIIHSITGFGNLKIMEQEKNIGLANSVITGVTRLTEKFGKVIVMEDDLESSPYMLRYFNEALDKYQNEEQVMHIGAYMYPINPDGLPESFFFRMATSWGWATWARAWKHFEPDIEKLFHQFDEDKITAFSVDRSENFWKQVNELRTGKINSWAIRWYASLFLAGGLALHPGVSMTNNIGNDASGRHSESTNMYDVKVSDKKITEFPEIIQENEDAYNRIKHFYRTRKGSWFNRAVRYIRTNVNRYNKL